MKKIAFIGMMGSGKSTIGKMLSDRIKLDFFCTDEFIEKKYNKSISDIFKENGEKYFRRVETEAIKELSEKRDIVLSTGGGVVLNKSNIDLLRENNFLIICLNRDIEKIIENISIENRPLIKNDINNLRKIYKERELLYKKYSDIIINNDDNIDETLEKLINIL